MLKGFQKGLTEKQRHIKFIYTLITRLDIFMERLAEIEARIQLLEG